MDIFTLIISFVIGILVGLAIGGRKKISSFTKDSMSKKKKDRKEKVMLLFSKKNKVSNNDVEKALGVSDATATRYLSELEKEGKIRQVGSVGAGVYYEKK